MAKKKIKRLEKKQGKAAITKQNKDKTVEETEENVGEEKVFEGPVCNVGLSLGFTEPDSDDKYANTKVSVSLYVPCERKDIDETFKFVKKWTSNKLQKLYDEAKDQR